jgi:hypothetical protein
VRIVVDNTGCLLVGPLPVCDAAGVEDDLLAVFRDDMVRVWQVPAEEYTAYMFVDGPFVEAAEFRAHGRIIAARLDLMGISEPRVMADLGRTLKAEAEPLDEASLASYSAMPFSLF